MWVGVGSARTTSLSPSLSPSSLVLFESSYPPVVSCATVSWRSCSKLNAGLDANKGGPFQANGFPDHV